MEVFNTVESVNSCKFMEFIESRIILLYFAHVIGNVLFVTVVIGSALHWFKSIS